MTKTSETKKDYSIKWNRFLYSTLVLLSAYFFFISKDISSAVPNLGIALAFDPFDSKITWTKRPIWQRAWLLVHVSLVFTGLGFMIFGK